MEKKEEPLFLKYLKKKENKLIDDEKKNKNEPKNDIKPSPPIKKTKVQKYRLKSNISINNLKTSGDSDKSIKNLSNSIIEKREEKSLKDNVETNKKNEKKIQIDTTVMNYNLYELNTLTYEEALKEDKRNFIQYYFSLLKTQHLLMFSFYPINDYNSKIIKIDLFFLYFTISYTINALFFSDQTMHQIYEDEGKFNFIYQIPQIIYSALISGFLNYILKLLSLTERNVIQIKHDVDLENIDQKGVETIKCIRYKYILFYLIGTPFLFLCLYDAGCFCAVYKNTQIHLIKDSLISLGITFLYPVFLFMLPGIFRIPALRAEKKDKELMYKFSKLIQMV